MSLKIKTFSGEGAQTPPQTRGGTPPPQSPPPRRFRRLDPRAFGARPPHFFFYRLIRSLAAIVDSNFVPLMPPDQTQRRLTPDCSLHDAAI